MAQKKYQKILENKNFGHFKVINKDTVMATVDGEPTTFYRSDQYSQSPGSDRAKFGSVGGDWRMIQGISEDVAYVFDLIDSAE